MELTTHPIIIKMNDYPETADIETSSDDYADRFSGEVGQYFLQEQLNIAIKQIELYGKATILDVGGGHAQLAVPLVEKGFDVTVTGSDDSCRQRLARFLPAQSYKYTTCNMLELPYPDNSFDIVLAFRLIPHVDRWKELVGELSRVARKAVIVDYPDIRSTNILNFLFFRLKKSLEGNTRPFGLFSRKQIGREFNKHGLVVVSFNPEFLLPMVVHRKIGSSIFSQLSEKVLSKLGLTRLFGSPVVVHLKKLVEK